VLLLSSNFKPAPAGKIYEMWIIPKGAQPAPAGLFAPRADGSVIHIAKPIDQPLAAVAVTVEPERGSDHPTTKPFLVATP
jgi:anti-sigma-K factor RskA